MPLEELEKNHLTEAFLDLYKQRLTGKPQPVIPPEGMLIELESPTNQSLVGSIGTPRDPMYDGPQPPNSMGMVLLVSPNKMNMISATLKGRFDISQRYIPDLALMKKELLFDGSTPRDMQTIADAYKRFTVLFEGVNFTFNVPNDLNLWKQDSSLQDGCLKNLKTSLLTDERIFRRRATNANGKNKIAFKWSDKIVTQNDLTHSITSELIEPGSTEILEYKVELRARVRVAPASLTDVSGALLLEVYLVNNTTTDEGRIFGVDNPFLLDCELTTDIKAGQHHPLPHKLRPEDYRHYGKDSLPGYGITCSVQQNPDGSLTTNCLPIIKQWAFETPSPAAIGMTCVPNFDLLSKDPLRVIDSLLNALDMYSKLWDQKIAALEANGETKEAMVARAEAEEFKKEITRVIRGRQLLRNEPDLLKSFKWMNSVMGDAVEKQGKNFKGWRLFQLGFILTQIEAIYERHHPKETEVHSWDMADVLWFSTGGGKTEAYLGIISMAMLYQRLNNRMYGTTAWLRFPLRMLSVQQFQRLSYVVAQANILRQKEGLGGHPFTIGYFTGRGTPSQISSSSDFYRETFLPLMSPDYLEGLKFISDCPYCDSKNSVVMKIDISRTRIKHVCNNDDCWTNTQAEEGRYGEGIRGEIGIFVSDEECYRFLPTVLVGTIDKLAVIGHNIRFSKFFGAAGFFCPEHGFTREGSCEHFRIKGAHTSDPSSDKCGNNSRTSAIKTVKMSPMVDPGFSICIQDELHLLRETLGNFDGHYETLLQSLQVMHGGYPAKILAATATIKDYEHHIHHLYQKEATRYPAPGIQQGESFYSRQKFASDGITPLVRRYYSSLLPVTRRSPVMRSISDASSRYFDLVDSLRNDFISDPVKTAKALSVDPTKAKDAHDYIEEHLNTNLIYANQKRAISEIGRFLDDANGKRGTSRLWIRLDGESTLEEIQGGIEHIETKLPNDDKRQLIATSVVSHGVDIERLNFMLLAGWPTSIAEYIQSSARSGRVHPGIVLTLLSYMKVYEHNVFLNFADYHQFLDKMVESVPINRFAPNILERTLPGILSATIINWASCQPWGSNIKTSIREIHKALNEPGSTARMDIEKAALKALHIDDNLADKWFDRRVVGEFRDQAKTQIRRGLNQLETWSGGRMDMYLGEVLERIYSYRPLQSFRDIERQISISAVNDSSDSVVDALRR